MRGLRRQPCPAVRASVAEILVTKDLTEGLRIDMSTLNAVFTPFRVLKSLSRPQKSKDWKILHRS